MKKRLNLFLTGNQIWVFLLKKGFISSFLIIAFMLNIGVLSAQEPVKRITGKVVSESGEPIPGVTIVVEGTSNGTLSDTDGNYSISVNSSRKKLVFSFIGMQTQAITIGDQKVINITLKQSNIQLDEVVAVGYGTMKRSDLTGSVASVRSGEIVSSGAGTIEQALRGRAAGVVINAADNSPGAGLTIKIRGTNSISASSAPLYVIDGFPIEGEYDSGDNLTVTAQSVLSAIDPADIESIDILKDASATAVYGARGANGVVIITTKSGKAGKMKVSFSAKTGLQKMIEKYELGDAEFYSQAVHDRYFPYDMRTNAPVQGDDYYKWWDVAPYSSPDTTNTNWLDEITQLGSMQNYNISLSGGNAKGNYLASVAYYKNTGIVKSTDFTRYTGNFKANGNPKEWLQLSFNSAFSFSENNGTVTVNSWDGGGGTAGILSQAIKKSPLISSDDKTLDSEDSDLSLIIGTPLEIVNNVEMFRKTLQSRSNFSMTLIPIKGLHITSKLGLTKNKMDFYSYFPSTTGWGANYNGRAIIKSNDFSSFLNENTVNYIKKSGSHSFNILGGFSQQYVDRMNTTMEASNFPIETLGYNNISVGESYSAPESYASDYVLLSYFGRLNYNFGNKYLATASFRSDGSSKFAKNNKWGYFPSFAFAWRAGEEEFIKNLDFFDNLKVRAGWGQTGNPNIDPYQSLTNYGLTKYPSGNTLNTGTYTINIGNSNLKWETSEQSNIGLDASILDSRLSFVVDLYLKKTKDLLLDGDIPASTGFTSYLYNAGSIENKGIEIAVNAIILDGDFKWSADFNFAINRNKVTDLGDLVSEDWMTVPGTLNWNTAMLQIGQPVGLWYGYQTDGLWQQDAFVWNSGSNSYVLKTDEEGNLPAARDNAQPGLWKFKDISGPDGVPDGEINSYDKGIIAISQPDFTGGLNSNFEYKNFDLGIFMEWSVGREVYNANMRHFTSPQTYTQNTIKFDYWKPIQYVLDASGNETSEILDSGNINAKYPLKEAYNTDMHDGYIEDGSYLRISNITLGYKFKPSILKKIDAGSLRIYCNVVNALTFTKYSGYDPNVNAQDLKGLRPGYDLNSYPLSRMFILGIDASF